MISKTLSELAQLIDAEIVGDSSIEISAPATLTAAGSGQISFLHRAKYRPQLRETKASAVVVAEKDQRFVPCAALVVEDPYYAFSVLLRLFDYQPRVTQTIHASAVIGQECDIDDSAAIAANVVIGDYVKIGKNVRIAANAVIDDYAEIADDAIIHANVSICHHVKIGARTIIHNGAVIGSDGFGNAMYEGRWHKIPQIGTVIIGADVEIGANTTIDRGALGDTVIADGVRIDNQVQLGHNVEVGMHSAIAGCAAIAGSTKFGRYCMIGGAACIAGHLDIGDGVILTGSATVGHSLPEAGIYSSGFDVVPNQTWRRNSKRMEKLDQQIKEFKKEIAALKEKGND